MFQQVLCSILSAVLLASAVMADEVPLPEPGGFRGAGRGLVDVDVTEHGFGQKHVGVHVP